MDYRFKPPETLTALGDFERQMNDRLRLGSSGDGPRSVGRFSSATSLEVTSMFKKALLFAAALSGLVLGVSQAQAGYGYGGYGHGYGYGYSYNQPYHSYSYNRPYYGYSYDRPYYGYSYNRSHYEYCD